MNPLSDAIAPADIIKYKLNCPTCNQPKLQHNYDVTCWEFEWEYTLHKQIPNLIMIENRWYHFSFRALMIPLIVKYDVGLVVDRRDSVIFPIPKLIETYGDIYNFCAQYNALDKLKVITTPEVFKSMQSKAIERALKRL